jgi:hypothetical protein
MIGSSWGSGAGSPLCSVSPPNISGFGLRLGRFFLFAFFTLLGRGSGLFRGLVGFDFSYCLRLPIRIGVSEDKLTVASPYACFGHFFVELVVVDLDTVLDHVDHIFGLACAGHAMDTPGFAHVGNSLACIMVAARHIRRRVLGEKLQYLLGAILDTNSASGAGFRIDHRHVVFHVNSVERACYFTVAEANASEIALVRAAERYRRGLASVKPDV